MFKRNNTNQNESINGVLWNMCPKAKFCGRSKLLLAVADIVLRFNSGAANKTSLSECLGIKTTDKFDAIITQRGKNSNCACRN